MDFKYIEKADQLVGFLKEETECDCCKQIKTCFDGEGFRGTDELKAVCPDCLKNGKLMELDVSACNGDVVELKKQIIQLKPESSAEAVDRLVNIKTNELEKTSPRLVTWQDWDWPAADGDYCRFIGFGSKPFYTDLAKGNNVEEFFKNSFYDPESYYDYLWGYVPDKKIKNYDDSNQYGTLFYVFKSLNSERVFTVWDCD
ncbi:MAG: hypothetical protein K0S32_4565 [Bacteroidetes bacterium]|jgi:uncharacterized protein CbrC (UPF0167 family)|nr:hypothetical protein [Bacteroidota bacterium]